jgi:hypothetical protein
MRRLRKIAALLVQHIVAIHKRKGKSDVTARETQTNGMWPYFIDSFGLKMAVYS